MIAANKAFAANGKKRAAEKRRWAHFLIITLDVNHAMR